MLKKLMVAAGMIVLFCGAFSYAHAQEAQLFTKDIRTNDVSRKEEIKKLQGFLINQQLLEIAEPTGNFGPLTKEAIRKFQRSLGLEQVGTVGPLTRAKINETLQAQSKSPDAKIVEEVQPEKIIVKPTDDSIVVLPNSNIPRVMFWWGKVNQHMNIEKGGWETDPNGFEAYAGASVDKLEYCKRFYPNTVAVRPYMFETIDGWRDRGNVGKYSSTNLSYQCVSDIKTIKVDPVNPIIDPVVPIVVEPVTPVLPPVLPPVVPPVTPPIVTPVTPPTIPAADPVILSYKHLPRVMFWWGKVNQHINTDTGTWETDPNGLEAYAGASVDKLTYCKMFYPASVAAVPFGYETIDSWHDRGNVNNYTSTNMAYRCVLKGESSTELPTGTVLGVAVAAADLKASKPIKTESVQTAKTLNYVFKKNLGPGSKDADVLRLQKVLIEIGYLNAEGATGVYDDATTAAVKQFQIDNKISPTGTVGPLTRTRLGQVSQGGSNACQTGSPRFAVTSPNGGEVYQAGQQVTVTWQRCGAYTVPKVDIVVQHHVPAGGGLGGGNYAVVVTNGTPNDGSQTITIPGIFSGRPFGQNFKIAVTNYPYTVGNTLYDVSDNLFTINAGATIPPTLSINTAQPDAISQVPVTNYKIASWNLTGSVNADVVLAALSLDIDEYAGGAFDEGDLRNLYMIARDSAGNIVYQSSPIATPMAAGNSFASNYVLPMNQTVRLELWGNFIDDGADLPSGAVDPLAQGDAFRTDLTVTVMPVGGGTAFTATPTDVNGQITAYAPSAVGTITATIDASTPATGYVYDNQMVETAKFKFDSTGVGFNVSDISVNIPTSATTVAQAVMLYDGATLLAAQPGLAITTFNGLSWNVPAGQSKILTVKIQVSTVGGGAGMTQANLQTTLTAFNAINTISGAATVGTELNPSGNPIYVYAGLPVITQQALSSNTLSNGLNKPLLKFNVVPNGGAITWKQMYFDLMKSPGVFVGTSASAGISLWDVTAGGNIQLAGTFTNQNIYNIGTSGTVRFIATNEEVVSSTKTYELRGNIANANASGAYVTTTLAQDSAAIVVSDSFASIVANDVDAPFVWSDVSAISHSVTTTDWTSDFMIQNLPITDTLDF
jgi:peptidoglycan hydrolase-like protein with peptidoglycan-binding domain